MSITSVSAMAKPPVPSGPSSRATTMVVSAPVAATVIRLAPDMTTPPVSGRAGGRTSGGCAAMH
jgi:hypothetical protein